MLARVEVEDAQQAALAWVEAQAGPRDEGRIRRPAAHVPQGAVGAPYEVDDDSARADRPGEVQAGQQGRHAPGQVGPRECRHQRTAERRIRPPTRRLDRRPLVGQWRYTRRIRRYLSQNCGSVESFQVLVCR
ncbi:MAG: hypothetical protein A2Y77_08855 [Planctomycetes bacterium RBG_13_62_9]|nr:MAG: hypothetical protein A2Y77_08855 [Planctomycetes bacterium RBG_13_62_9]